MLVTVALLTILVVLVVSLVRKRRKTFSYFKDIGIPGPKPNLIWGNLWEYHENGLFRALTRWGKEYGDIFGYYNGDVPMLAVRDPEFLQYVFIKNFANFPNRGITMRTDQTHPIIRGAVAHAEGSHWKSLRACVASGFTGHKIKEMMAHISEVCDVFMDVLGEKADEEKEVSMQEAFRGLTMDYIGRAAFGLENSFQRDLSNPFLKKAQKVLREIMTGPFHMMAQCTSQLDVLGVPILWLSRIFGSFSARQFAIQAYKVIELRKKNPELRRNDILQNLIDAEYEELSTQQTSSDVTASNGVKGTSRALSSIEVIMNTSVVFAAGYETTATSLCYLAFALGKYPDVQEKVRQEVNEAVSQYGSLDYETVTKKLKYVEQVVNETLRIMPPGFTFITRRAKEDFEYQGIRYKAGTCVISPTWDIHTDERFFPDPHRFDPERFSEENEGSFPKVCHQPFGLGPRNCLGVRLAMFELVYTVARMTQQFRWELGDSQKGEMPMEQRGMVSIPARGPWLVFHRI